MLDDHDAQAIGAIAAMMGAWHLMEWLEPSITPAFQGLVAIWMGVPGWYVADRAKHAHRATRYGRGGKRPTGFSYFVKKVFSPRLSAVGAIALVLLAGLSVFAVAATTGTGIDQVDREVYEMIDGRLQNPEVVGDRTRDVPVWVASYEGSRLPRESIIQEAIDYWEGEGKQYSKRDIEFYIVDEREDAEVDIVFEDSVSCLSPLAVGCATITESDGGLIRATIQIERGRTRVETALIAKHEFGHVLNLSHSDEPRWIMDPDARVVVDRGEGRDG